jgi:hypothetical protein
MKRFGSIDAAATALGVTSGALYPYMDPKGKKQKAGKVLKQPGTQLLVKLAAHGCDLQWLLTGCHGKNATDQVENSVPVSPIDTGSPRHDESESPTSDEDRERLAFLDALGLKTTEQLRKFLDPEALIKDIVALYVARTRPSGGK